MRNINFKMLNSMNDEDMLTTKVLSRDILSLKDPGYVRHYRNIGTFTCPFYKIGNCHYYRVADLKKYFLSVRVDPVADKQQAKEIAAEVSA